MCGGDLLWLLSPTLIPLDGTLPQPEQPTTKALKQVENTGPSGQPQASAPVPNQADHSNSSSAAIAPSPAAEPSEPEAMDTEAYDVPVGNIMPAYMLRVLCSNSVLASSPHGVAVLAVHAAMLETGFTLGNEPGSTDQLTLPDAAALAANTHRVAYRLAAAPESTCTVTCSSMGSSTLITAAPPAEPSRFVQIQSPVVELDSSSTPGGSSGTLQPVAGAASMPSHVALMPDQRGAVLHGRLALDAAMVRALWITLKDGIALPMQVACCTAAGLQPPATLLSLPTELKMRLLGTLGPLELAAVASSCTELRHLAGGNELWEPLFKAQFPFPSVYVAEAADRRGYKWAFGFCWMERRRREEERRRQRARFFPAVPQFGPRPPFYPPAPPPRFPGVTGGDQDRLPFLGGTGSFGSGRYGAPFNLFGSGGARRQGGPSFRWT